MMTGGALALLFAASADVSTSLRRFYVSRFEPGAAPRASQAKRRRLRRRGGR